MTNREVTASISRTKERLAQERDTQLDVVMEYLCNLDSETTSEQFDEAHAEVQDLDTQILALTIAMLQRKE